MLAARPRPTVPITPPVMRVACLLLALGLALGAGSLDARAQDRPEDAPVVLAHYMPWYQAKPYAGYWGYHWTMNSFNPDVTRDDGLRDIASQYYPAIGPYDSRDPDVLEYQALMMKVAGIDGVAVDWYGSSSLYDYPLIDDATEAFFEVAGRLGLSFTVCYEDATLRALVDQGRIEASEAAEQARADMATVQDRWVPADHYLTYDGAPVVLNFGPQYLRSSSQWETAFEPFETAPVFVTEDRRLAPVAAGAYPWPPMSRSVNGVLSQRSLDQYLTAFYTSAQQWPLTVGGAFPGFHDIYAEAGVRPSYGYLDDRDGATMAETLARAIGSGAPIIQIATWNDYGEGTMIEPTLERGTRDLEEIQRAVRAGRPLPYAAADFDLPARIYQLRTFDADPAQLDQAASLLAAGDPAGARNVLSAFATSTPDGPPSVEVTLGPNPARGPVTLAVTLPAAADVRAEVYDALGRRVATLASGPLGAGRHVIEWGGGGQPSGVYLVRVRAGGETAERRLTLVR